jgi:cytochrome c oxidase subunit 2
MLDLLFTGWGAFWMMLFRVVPFGLMFWYVIRRKSVVEPGPSATPRGKLARLEGVWLAVVFVVFVGVNLASLRFMPTIAAARAATSGEPLQEISFTAKSWGYDLSSRQIETGRPVRFSGKSSDTQHGFAVYHPDGSLLFTMMMIPGLARPTTLIHTFKDPGKYKVRCLEYCGIAHHGMMDELTVVKAN